MEQKDIISMRDSVKLRLGEDTNIEDSVITNFVKSYYNIACVETGYNELPSLFYEYIISASVESCQRMGHEGISNRSELGVNTSYSYKDVETSLRSKLKGKKNPRLFLGYWS